MTTTTHRPGMGGRGRDLRQLIGPSAARIGAALSLCTLLVACAGTGGGAGGDAPLLNSDADSTTAAPGAGLPFAQIATTCGVQAASLGTAVVSDAGYTVYDTNPAQVTPRTHYVDGFGDGCLRQFTAALVLLGPPATHETQRYATESRSDPYSPTDQAYEAIKGAFCRVPSGQPCGARLAALSQRTVFVTAYPSFSESNDWAEFLLHEGVVAGAGREQRS